MDYDVTDTVGSGNQALIMTWFGSVLVNEPVMDWLAHRPTWQADTDHNFLLLDMAEVVTAGGSFLRQVRPRPRALPRFSMTGRDDGRVHLRCTDSGAGGDALPDHLLCAIPDGTLEVNRSSPSDWETFLLLPLPSYRRIEDLLGAGQVLLPDGQPATVSMGLGQVMTAGHHLIDIAANLGALSRPGSELRLTTTAGLELPVSSR